MENANWSELLKTAVNVEGVISSAYSTFHNYSIGNQLLAWSQLTARGLGVTPISTYKKWQQLNRVVKKGEKAIALFMPVTFKVKKEEADDEFTMTKFMLKNAWFSLEQTDGEDYINDVVIHEWNKQKAMETLAIKEIPFTMINGNCQGYATQDNAIAINPLAVYPFKTRFHELAHIVLGHTSEGGLTDSEHTPKDIKEVEAESVAYICISVLGLGGQSESRGYIQNWLDGNDITDKSAQRIMGAASKILKAGSKNNLQNL